MLTKEQENYLAALADRGIADDKEAEVRQAEVDKIHVPIEEAKQARLDELNKQGRTLINEGLKEFEANVVPVLWADDVEAARAQKEAELTQRAQGITDVGIETFVETVIPEMLAKKDESDEVASN